MMRPGDICNAKWAAPKIRQCSLVQATLHARRVATIPTRLLAEGVAKQQIFMGQAGHTNQLAKPCVVPASKVPVW